MNKSNKRLRVLEKALEQSDAEQRDALLASHGGFLDRIQTKTLLRRIESHPEDLDARWTLAGNRAFIGPKDDEHLAQLLQNLIWLIRHHPESKGHEVATFVFPLPIFEEVKLAWKRELRKHKDSAAVASNAGHAFVIIDQPFATRCYEKAVGLSPTDPGLWKDLSHIYRLRSSYNDILAGQKFARKSIEALLTALKLQGTSRDGYVGMYWKMLLVNAAELAFRTALLDQASTLGKLLIKMAKVHTYESDYCKPNRRHGALDIGNAVLGLVALEQNKIELALRQFKKLPGAVCSEALILALANGLIRKREYTAVLNYLERCRDCMESAPGSDQDQSAKLAQWQAALERSRSVKLKPW